MDILVLMDEPIGGKALPSSWTLVHRASPRLIVVRLSGASPEEIADRPDVVVATVGALPPDVIPRLEPDEAVFAAAFAARRDKGERIGEGLEWDASGFEPPDAPSSPERDERSENAPNQEE